MYDLLEGLKSIMTIESFIFINFGVLIGFVFGAIPGLTGYLGIVLMLPLTYGMSPIVAILMLLGIYCGGNFGGSISAILIGTPGTGVAAATLIDGYPLAKKGKGFKALDMALTASSIGGFLSAISLLLFAPVIAKLAVKFGPPEYFALAIFGLAVIGGVSARNMGKGLASGAIGVLLSMIGLDGISGTFRFTFGNLYLYNGLPMMALLMGVFALSKIMTEMQKSFSGEDNLEVKAGGVEVSSKDKLTWNELKGSLRSIFRGSFIGIIIGAIPAAGPAIASFMSYNQARTKSKNPEKFGKGSLEGVAAPESANNAVTGSCLIPMLTIGIPGTAAAALLLGALTVHGLAPGPNLFKDHSVIVYGIMVGLVFTNIIMYLQGRIVIKYFSMITRISPKTIFTAVLILCTAGSFTPRGATFDLYVMIGAAVVGYYMIKFDFPPAPIVIGLILGPVAENNLRRSLVMSEGSWSIFYTRPICLIFIILTFLMIYGARKQQLKEKEMLDTKAA